MTHLHEIVHTLVTSGVRPRPRTSYSEECEPVPVLVALYRPGESEPFAIVPVQAFALHKHQAEITRDGVVVSEERRAELMLTCEVPEEKG